MKDCRREEEKEKGGRVRIKRAGRGGLDGRKEEETKARK